MIHCDPLHDHSPIPYYHSKMSWGRCDLRLVSEHHTYPIPCFIDISTSSIIEHRPISTFVVLLITADLGDTAFLSSSARFFFNLP